MSLTSNGFIYKAPIGAKGETEKALWDAGLDRVDARLGKEIWVGSPGYGNTIYDALIALDDAQVTLRVPAGTHAITSDLSIPANVNLQPTRGAVFNIADTKTLTINGGLDAGLYQIFSCGTGKVVFGAGSVKQVIPQWWGAVGDGTTDCTAAMKACFNAYLATYIPPGSYKLNGDVSRTATGSWSIRGEYDLSVLNQYADADVISLTTTYGKLTVSNLMIMPQVAMTTGAAIRYSGAVALPSTILNNVLVVSPSAGVDFAYGVHLNNAKEASLNNVVVYGVSVGSMVGIYITNTAPNSTCPVKISQSAVYQAAYGIKVVLNGSPAVEGVQCYGVDLVNVNYGFYVDGSAATYQAPQFNYIGGHIDANIQNVYMKNVGQNALSNILMYNSSTAANAAMVDLINTYTVNVNNCGFMVISGGDLIGLRMTSDGVVATNNIVTDNIFSLAGTATPLIKLVELNGGTVFNPSITNNKRMTGTSPMVDTSGVTLGGFYINNPASLDQSDYLAYISGATGTLDCTRVRSKYIKITGVPTNITNIIGFNAGDTITLEADGAFVLQHVANCLLRGGYPYTFTAGGPTITLYKESTTGWREIGRSD